MTTPLTLTTVPGHGADGGSGTPVSYTDTGTGSGAGKPVLLLHGGGGPATVAGFAALLAAGGEHRVITPVHPGFEGTPRPAGLTDPAGLARLYTGLLDTLGLRDVTVVGNSLGGWTAAEMALVAAPAVGRYVLVDAVGLDLPEAPVVDFFSLTLPEVADLSYHEPDKFRIDPAELPAHRQAATAGNREALRVYGGPTMADPTLRERLVKAAGPTLVVWGAADRIVPPLHGRTYAAAMPDARYELIPDAGHLPQLETPATLVRLVSEFASAG